MFTWFFIVQLKNVFRVSFRLSILPADLTQNDAPNAWKTTISTTIVTTNPSDPHAVVAVPLPSKAPASATTQLHDVANRVEK